MPSTYSNIGLELQATGENSGTWGTKANTVFELLDEAVAGMVTVNFASDADKTITATDGATSDARHMVLILTSTTLTATRTLTIAPNDMEKTYIIYNNTTGSQDIIVEQGGGSGATVTIENGHRAMVYCDGTGANANVYSVMNNIEMHRPLLNSYTERRVALGTVTTANCDLSLYSLFEITAGASLTINFQNAAASGLVSSATLVVTNNATPVSSYTWNYGGGAISSLLSPGGTNPAPTNSASAKDVFTAFTYDGGTTFFITEAMLNVS